MQNCPNRIHGLNLLSCLQQNLQYQIACAHGSEQYLQILMFDNNKCLSVAREFVRYHDPYSRLSFRFKCQQVLASTATFAPLLQASESIDIISIIDAVFKRGGYYISNSRIEEIYLSLGYLAQQQIKKGIEMIKTYESELIYHLGKFPTYNDRLLESHLVGLQPGDENESNFVRDNFSCVDEYLCVKTLAHFGADLHRIESKFLGKYFRTRKQLYIWDRLTNIFNNEIETLSNIEPARRANVCIVGMSIPSFLLAIKLGSLGQTVKIYDTDPATIIKYAESYSIDIVRQGIMMLNYNQHKQLSYLLEKYFRLNLEKYSYHSDFMEHMEDLYTYESTLMLIIRNLLAELPNSGNKVLWSEVKRKADNMNEATAGNEPISSHGRALFWKQKTQQIDIDLLKITLSRFIIVNKLKAIEELTVFDIRDHMQQYFSTQSSASLHSQVPYSASKLGLPSAAYHIEPKTNTLRCQQVAKYNNIDIFLDSVLDSASYAEGKWRIVTKPVRQQSNREPQIEQFEYLIYSDYTKLMALNQPNAQHLPGLQNQISLPLLHEVAMCGYYNLMFSFDEEVCFRVNRNESRAERSNYGYYTSEYGMIHFFIMMSGREVLAVIGKTSKQRNIEAGQSKYIQNVLCSRILRRMYRPTKSEEVTEFSTHFWLRQPLMRDKIISPSSNMYLSMPLDNSPCNTLSTIHTNNWIVQDLLGKLAKNQHKPKISKLITESRMDAQSNRPVDMSADFSFGINNQRKQQTSLIQQQQQIQFCEEVQQPQPDPIQTLGESQPPLTFDYFNLEHRLLVQLTTNSLHKSQLFQSTLPTVSPFQRCRQSLPLPSHPSPPATTLHPLVVTQCDSLHYSSQSRMPSLLSPGRSCTHFYTSFDYDRQRIFCIAQQYSNKLFLLFHNNYRELCEIYAALYKYMDVPMQRGLAYERKLVLVQAIREQIRREISEHEKNQNESNLYETCAGILCQKVKIVKDCHRTGVMKDLGFDFGQDCSALARLVVAELEEYIGHYVGVLGLRKYSLGDIFVGKLHPLYIAMEIAPDDTPALQLTQCLRRLVHPSRFPLHPTPTSTSRTFPHLPSPLAECHPGPPSPHPDPSARPLLLQLLVSLLRTHPRPLHPYILHQLQQLVYQQLCYAVQLLNWAGSDNLAELTVFRYFYMSRLQGHVREASRIRDEVQGWGDCEGMVDEGRLFVEAGRFICM